MRGLMVQASSERAKGRSAYVAVLLENMDGYDPIEDTIIQVVKEWHATCLSIGTDIARQMRRVWSKVLRTTGEQTTRWKKAVGPMTAIESVGPANANHMGH